MASTTDFEELFINLKILATLQSYNKINTKEKYFRIVGPASSTGLPVWIQRWWNGENREDALIKIQSLYTQARTILNHDQIPASEKKRLKDHVLQSLHGLNALKKTYEGCPTTIAKLSVLTDFGVAILQDEPMLTHISKDVSNMVLQAVLKHTDQIPSEKPVPLPDSKTEPEL